MPPSYISDLVRIRSCYSYSLRWHHSIVLEHPKGHMLATLGARLDRFLLRPLHCETAFPRKSVILHHCSLLRDKSRISNNASLLVLSVFQGANRSAGVSFSCDSLFDTRAFSFVLSKNTGCFACSLKQGAVLNFALNWVLWSRGVYYMAFLAKQVFRKIRFLSLRFY